MRMIYIDALLDDGSMRRPIAPQSGATTIRVNQGEDTRLVVIVWLPSGGRKLPKAGDTFTIVVKARAVEATDPALLTIAGAAQSDGTWRCDIAAAAMLPLEPERYVFTGKLVEATGDITSYPIPLSTLILQPTAG